MPFVKLENVTEIVDRLNDAWWKVMEKRETQNYVRPFTVTTDGICQAVLFLEIALWDSENDTREYDEAKDEFEPLEGYLRREVQSIAKDILEVFP